LAAVAAALAIMQQQVTVAQVALVDTVVHLVGMVLTEIIVTLGDMAAQDQGAKYR
jgi:hypothetical protein